MINALLASLVPVDPAHEQVHLWNWLLLGAIVIGLLAFDFVGHVRKAHEPSVKEAAIWSGVYMAFAALFGLVIWAQFDLRLASQYWAGWLTEWALSVDNLFVFIIILSAFAVPRIYQQKVIMWGIIISIVLRLGFILLGAAIIEHFAGVFYLFGLFLVYTAVKQAHEGVAEPDAAETEEYRENGFTRVLRRILPVSAGYDGAKFFTRARGDEKRAAGATENASAAQGEAGVAKPVAPRGKLLVTPLFLVVFAVGSADLMFAFDSIPAIFGLTSHPYIVFAATSFSLLGLRQLFFLVDGLLEKLALLHYGLALILGFIGLKMIVHASHASPLPYLSDLLAGVPEPSTTFSMLFIICTLVGTGVGSLLYSRAQARKKQARP